MPRRGADRFEFEFQPPRFSDPVPLHQPDLLRPPFQTVEGCKQFLGVVAYPEKPLVQRLAFDFRAGPPSLAVDHLLIGKHRLVDRIPVHDRFLAIDKALLHHVDEHGLLRTVVFGVAGRELAAPIDGESELHELLPHVGDVFPRPRPRMDVVVHRGVLCGHAERVPPHRMENVESLGLAVARYHVAHRVIAHVPHVDFARGVRKHLEDIVFGLRFVSAGAENTRVVPSLPPARFKFLSVVIRHHIAFVEAASPLRFNPADSKFRVGISKLAGSG